MNELGQFVRFLKEARDSQNFFTLNRLRDAAKKKFDRELLEETWTNICFITELVDGALCKVKPEKEEEERAIVVDEKMKESIERIFSGKGPFTYLATLSGVIKGGKDLTDAVEGLTTRFKKLNPYVTLFYFPEDTEDTFKRLMKRILLNNINCI